MIKLIEETNNNGKLLNLPVYPKISPNNVTLGRKGRYLCTPRSNDDLSRRMVGVISLNA
jgi:hypothetical protein